MSARELPHWMRHSARLRALRGAMLYADLQRTFVGERCLLVSADAPRQVLAEARTTGFDDAGSVLCLMGDTQGLPRDTWVVPTGRAANLQFDTSLLGAVLDGAGRIVGRLAPARETWQAPRELDLEAPPPALARREAVSRLFETGVRCIDGLASCGVGQRVGIFAPAGAGKTSLITMLLAHARAQRFVIALVGERGREASEFVASQVPEAIRERTVLVCSTSDRPAAERRNAAHIAFALAEHFRAQGEEVLLVLDSMTRYARALREMALAAGEKPARRGYPASVFDALPRLLERAGALQGSGAITAFLTVLLEDAEHGDPIAEEIRSIVDGHLYLSRKLADRAHFPAIDALGSASRVMGRVADSAHREAAAALRGRLARLDDLQLALDLGEYRPGVDPDTDALLAARPAIEAWLCQDMNEFSPFAATVERINALL